jgi:hypothetical protein
MTILYPVAASVEAALAAPAGRAAREREAKALAAGEAVHFVCEETGPLFSTREAALDAYAGRLDDDRRGRAVQVAPEDRYLTLRPVSDAQAPPPPIEPSFADGRRWPAPPAARPTLGFRLLVSYWRIGEAAQQPLDQARSMRRRVGARPSREEVRALARQPLRAVRPQQPLDIGLFEAPAPEAPHILIPDD